MSERIWLGGMAWDINGHWWFVERVKLGKPVLKWCYWD